MKQTFLMERVMGQTRLAVIEDGALCELYHERPGEEKLAGNIYSGRVENVLPGMNAAFVDIGMKKNAFLHAGDIQIDVRAERGLAERLEQARIERMLRPGQRILVQVTKEPGGAKGPRISCHVALSGRLLVLLPDMRYVGVSRKIDDDAERARLYAAAHGLMGESAHGMIVRTAAMGASREALAEEYRRATELWESIRRRGDHAAKPGLIHSDGSLALRAVRDMLSENTGAILVQDVELCEELRDCAAAVAPSRLKDIRLHQGEMPLFDTWRVDVQLEKCAGKYVWLKSGGSLVIEETEALTVIDVNSGKFVGKRSLEETIFRINCEAAREAMRQIRLRDLGGIIIVDFIDMEDEAQKQALLALLRDEAARDRNHVGILGFTALGLVEMTRKKVRQPLSRQLMHACEECNGSGRVPSHETVARGLVREIWRRRCAGDAAPLLAEGVQPVIGWLETIGAPAGGPVYAHISDALKPGEYRLSPVDINDLPAGTKLLK